MKTESKKKKPKNKGLAHRPKVTSMFSSESGKSKRTATRGKISGGMFTSGNRASKAWTIVPHRTIRSR